MTTEPLPEDSVPTWYVNLAVRWSDLDPDSRLLMLVLSDIADNATAQIPPQREPSTKQLMRETGRGKDLVIDRRRKLQEAGWLELTYPSAVEMARHGSIRYRLLVPADAEPPDIARPVPGQPAPRRTAGRRGGPGSAGTTPDAEGAMGTGADRTDLAGSAGTTPGADGGVGGSDPGRDGGNPGRGRQDRPRGVGGNDPAGSMGPTPSLDVPNDVPDGFEKPPSADGDPVAERRNRLAVAEELEQLFWARYGTSSAQPRGAIRSVIITAIVDNEVPRYRCAKALDVLGARGKQITRDSLTAQLGSMAPVNPRPLVEPEPNEEPAWARRARYCTVHGHETTQLTPAGLCPNCAGDSRARAWGAKADTDPGPPEPSLGALLLDHGGRHEVEMSRTEALAQQSRDRTYLEYLPDADHWRDLADEHLDAQHPNDDPDFVPHPGAVDAVAAELHRRWRRQARTENGDT